MRKQLSVTLVTAVALTALAACSGPNAEAAEAAADYSAELTTWVEALADPGEELGPVLEDAPTLEKFDDVDHTPTYLLASDVATRIDIIVGELAALEPDALDALDGVADEAFWITADLYYDTLGAATDRLTAIDATSDLDDDGDASDARVAAHLAFAEARVGFLERAVDALPAITPGDGLGVSVSAFAEDWYGEELAFLQSSIAEIGSWEVLSNGYKDFWNFGNLGEVYRAPREFSSSLRPAFVHQAQGVAVELATVVADPDAAAPDLPALGDPYRAVLLEGFLPWGDSEATEEYTANRLWALWRIRELEETPDDAYLTARTTLMEELNRSVKEGTAQDFRPGSTRLLDLVDVHGNSFESVLDQSAERWVSELSDVHSYGLALTEQPMTAEVAAALEEVLAIYQELNLKVAELVTSTDDEGDLLFAANNLGDEYREKVVDAASPALGALDDDAKFEQQLAQAITATATQ